MATKRIAVKQRVIEIMRDLYKSKLGSVDEGELKKRIRAEMRRRKISLGSIKNYISAMRKSHEGWWVDEMPYSTVKGLLVRGKKNGELAISVEKARSLFHK